MRTSSLRSILAAAALALLVASPAVADHPRPETFIAIINAPQEVPPVLDSNGQGLAFFTYDSFTRELCYSISYDGLEQAEIASHIHGPAEPGENAGVLFPISPESSPLGSPKSGCVGRLTSSQGRDLRNGLLYFNVHTSDFPNGEIRGQIVGTGQNTQFVRSRVLTR
jgi:hypothetical protein